MTGLLRKEFCVLKPQLKSWIMILVFFAIYSYMTNNMAMFFAMVAVMGTLSSMTSFSYDNQSQWQVFAMSLPVGRRKIVLAKYLIILLINVFFAAISLLWGVLLFCAKRGEFVSGDIIAGVSGALAATILIEVILLPVLFHVGPEIARYVILIIGLLPMILTTIAGKAGFALPRPSKADLFAALKASPFLLVCLLAVSIWLSVKIYEKKEF